MSLRLDYSALSDVGRVRKNNQDSGYAGPWLLAVCDGVGGAARGDIASGTAIGELRRLDEDPADRELLGLVAGSMQRAHDRISDLVEEDSALSGTSTTATVILFDGSRIGVGHVGDSRAYLLREGVLSQLTHDHTFVQSLVDEGRITDDEARTHPHRNLILKVLDGSSDLEPDLFTLDVAPGDRILVCSDGACGYLADERLGAILGEGTPDFASVELVRASLDAGSTDNVTCVVADVVGEQTDLSPDLSPLLVGAAAELPRRTPSRHGIFRHRDTGELDPIRADIPAEAGGAIASDPIDPEEARYAPQPRPRFLWLRRILSTLLVLGLALMAAGLGGWWANQQFYVSDSSGNVAIYRGLQGTVVGFRLSEPYRTTNVSLDQLSSVDRAAVRDGIDVTSLDDAERVVQNLYADADPATPDSTSDSASGSSGAP